MMRIFFSFNFPVSMIARKDRAAQVAFQWTTVFVFFALIIIAFCSLARAGNIQMASQPYFLGPQDKIRINVYEWRATIDEIHVWKAVNNTFTVGPNGKLSFPLVGNVDVQDKTVDDLGRYIARKLQEKMSLADLPNVTAEVVKYRPFYITGVVRTPGEYAYRPNGLTVLQAITIAGGLDRRRDQNRPQQRRYRIEALGTIAEERKRLQYLTVRKRRLLAEIKGEDKVSFDDLAALAKRKPFIANLIVTETETFAMRKKAFEEEWGGLQEQKNRLLKESNLIKESIEVQKKSSSKLTKHYKQERHLKKRQLLSARTLRTTEQVLATRYMVIQRSRRDLLQVKHGLGQVTQSINNLMNKRKLDLRSEFDTIEREILRYSASLNTAENMLQDILMNNPMASHEHIVTYKIVRKSGPGSIEFVVSENTRIRPGDLVKVKVSTGEIIGKGLENAQVEKKLSIGN